MLRVGGVREGAAVVSEEFDPILTPLPHPLHVPSSNISFCFLVYIVCITFTPSLADSSLCYQRKEFLVSNLVACRRFGDVFASARTNIVSANILSTLPEPPFSPAISFKFGLLV